MKAFDFYFRIDARSLALFRILLGILLIIDWFYRWETIPYFYAETGISPLISDIVRGSSQWHFCLLDCAKSLEVVRSIFLVGLASYVCFLAGFRTRSATVVALIFYSGVVTRVPIIRYAGDSAILVFLTWSCFLPMGQLWSVDARKLKTASALTPPNLAALFIVAQIGIIYLATACAKYGADWRDGSALYYAWQLDGLVRPLGQYLRNVFPLGLMSFLTYATLLFEWSFFFLIMANVRQPWPRRFAIISSSALMLAIWLTMDVGIFPLVMLVANALLLLPQDWALIQKLTSHWSWSRLLSASYQENGLKHGKLFWAGQAFLVVLGLAHFVNGYNNHIPHRFGVSSIAPPEFLRALTAIPQAGQNWKMFAPQPSHRNGWYVFQSEREDGATIDILNGEGRVSFLKPTLEQRAKGNKWRKIYERMCEPKYAKDSFYWAHYVGREYNRNKKFGKRVYRIKVFYIEEETPPPGSKEPPQNYMSSICEWNMGALSR